MFRRTVLFLLPAALAGILACGQWAAAQETLTYVDLVDRLVDLEHLAVLPPGGEDGAMCSSYDRKSRYDVGSGKYVNWHANNDGPQFIRTEGKSVVLAEMKGPGVLWRIWSALAQSGHVKIYLDGQKEPAVDMPFEHYFDGSHAPFNYPALSYQLEDLGCRGCDLYFPIPYRKSCKVVAEEGWGRYYQFTYSKYPPRTGLPAFSDDLSDDAVQALSRVNGYLENDLGTDPAGARDGQETLAKSIGVAAGRTAQVARLAGARAITAIRVKMDFKDRDDEMAALRKLALQITFDGDRQPAVWCPLGDFFGTAPGVNKYKSLVTGMTGDGFYSLWYMPFATQAVVELINDDEQPRNARFEITHAPLERPFAGLGHFHCKWHRDVSRLPSDRWPDWTVLETEGRGRFCGMLLHVWNPRSGHHAPAGEGHWWWGEGDEKFFVDGELFPTTFGTGTEDYFGYAWCDWHLFQRPFHNQTMTEQNAGHQAVSRWQIADNVPFRRAFDGYLEKYFPNQRPTLYAATVCWYLAPGGTDPFGPLPVEYRHGYYRRPEIVEAGFRVIGRPVGHLQTQDMSKFKQGKWKDNNQLWWQLAQPGDKLDIELPVEKSGKRQVSVVLSKAANYAVVQFYLDDEKVGGPVDGYSPTVTNTEPISLGVHDLTAGNHRLTVEIVGSNEKAKANYQFGLDQIIVSAAE